MMKRIKYPIKVVARRTGLSPHVIRAWEKRYNAISPKRTETNRRLYSDEDIERLILLRYATMGGWNIGQVARYGTEQLKTLVQPPPVETVSTRSPEEAGAGDQDRSSRQLHLETCLRAVEGLDGTGLERALSEASVFLSQPVLLEEVITPLMWTIGERWRQGSVRVAQEHLTSAIVRTFLGRLSAAFEQTASAPAIVVTTPVGQLHELAALIVAITAASEGWRVTYLGPNLPADEIAGAVHQQNARAVALSIAYRSDDPYIRQDLIRLRHMLSQDTAILAGGKGTASCEDVLDGIGATQLEDMQGFRQALQILQIQSTGDNARDESI